MKRAMTDYVEQFHAHWQHFAVDLQLDPTQRDNLYAKLLQAYSEPQRAYHTLQHLVECLDLFQTVRDQLNDSMAVELAIWFHECHL